MALVNAPVVESSHFLFLAMATGLSRTAAPGTSLLEISPSNLLEQLGRVTGGGAKVRKLSLECLIASTCGSLCHAQAAAQSGRENVVQTKRTARLFRNGRNQAIRIPRDLELPGSEVLLRKEGNRLIVEPVPRKVLLEILATWEPLDEECPGVDDLEPIEDVNL